jgi:hypothetical protein
MLNAILGGHVSSFSRMSILAVTLNLDTPYKILLDFVKDVEEVAAPRWYVSSGCRYRDKCIGKGVIFE